MKKQSKALSSGLMTGTCLRSTLVLFFFLFLYLFPSGNNAIAQNAVSKESNISLAEYEDQVTIEYMKANGATEATIKKWIQNRKDALASGDYKNPNYPNPATAKNPIL